jgi:DNA polymerase-3 subunit delta'
MSPEDAATLIAPSGGSIGRALALAGEGGLELAKELDALFAGLPQIDAPALHRFADRLARSGADGAYQVVTSLMSHRLAGAIAAAARAGAGEGEESALARRLAGLAPLDRWIEVWDKVARLFKEADGLHLDRKQVVLNAFFALERAARDEARP